MRLWRTVLLFLLAAFVAALAWHWLAADPGYVQVRLRGTTVESSLVVAIALLLLAWASLTLAWGLARWPLRAWGRSVARRKAEKAAKSQVKSIA